MIISVHVLDAGLRRAPGLRRRLTSSAAAAGATYAGSLIPAPLGPSLLPSPQPSRVGLVAAWKEDAAIERFIGSDPDGPALATGWHLRAEPVRVFGSWSEMPELPDRQVPVDDRAPVAVLTLGRLRPRRAVAFLRASAAAEAALVDRPELLAATGMGRPPLFATFSVWRTAGAMKSYARSQGGAHRLAVEGDRADPFHRESAFIRLRPYLSAGRWDGTDPLAGLLDGASPPG